MEPNEGLTVTVQFKGTSAESFRCDRIIIADGLIQLLLTENNDWMTFSLVDVKSVEVE
jgi:hypothetical protein